MPRSLASRPTLRAPQSLRFSFFASVLAVGLPGAAHADVRQLIVSSTLPRLACIEEAEVVATVLAIAPKSTVVFEQREAAGAQILVALHDATGERALRVLGASPDDCASLTEATSLVARTLLEQYPELPAPVLPEVREVPDAAPELGVPPALAAAPDARWRWGALARVGLNAGLLDAWAGTLSAGALARRQRFELSLELLGVARATALDRRGGQLRVRAFGGRLGVCAELLRVSAGFALGVCGRAELGALSVLARDFPARDQRTTAPFALLSPMLDAHYTSPRGYRVGITGGPSAALIRHEFTATSPMISGDSEPTRRVLFGTPRWGGSLDLRFSKIF